MASALSSAPCVLLISHIMPDADTLGSALGLAWALRKSGHEVRLSCADRLLNDLSFLPGSEAFAARSRTDEHLVVAIDASDIERIGRVYEPERFAGVSLVNIDHHVTNTHYGQINWVVPKSSTAELIYDLVCVMEIPLDPTIATCLLAGVVSDTRGFRTSSANIGTLRTATDLVEAGASLPDVADALFNHRSPGILPLWGAAFARAQISDGILWTEVSREMLAESGADLSASSGLVNFMSTLDGARVAVVFREVAEGDIDVSFRSSPGVDVSAVAAALGGGGHPQASGCQVRGSLAEARERVLAALAASLGPTQDRS